MFLQVCVCPQGGAAIPACIAGGIPACLAGFQAQTQGGSLGGSGWGGLQAHIQGEVEGDLVQAHGQGGSWGGSGPGPHPRGMLRGIWLGGCILLRAVRILLEYILVFYYFVQFFLAKMAKLIVWRPHVWSWRPPSGRPGSAPDLFSSWKCKAWDFEWNYQKEPGQL